MDILGSNVQAGAISKFGAGITVSSTTFVSSTKLTAKIAIASGTTTGVRTVKVVNPDKGTGSCVGCFSVT